MNIRDPVYDARASQTVLLLKNGFGKIQKTRKDQSRKNLKNFYRDHYRAYKSAFLQEIIPLLASGKRSLSHTEM